MTMTKRRWSTVNISWDTYENLMTQRLKGESLNNLIRRVLKLEIPDPTRGQRRHEYYNEDWKKD